MPEDPHNDLVVNASRDKLWDYRDTEKSSRTRLVILCPRALMVQQLLP